MTLSRNEQQDYILKLIYDYLLHVNAGIPFEFEWEVSGVLEDAYDDVDAYIKLAVIKAIKYEPEIISLITPFLVKWTWERLPLMTRAIFMFSVATYKYVGDIDKAVVINLAVQQAKAYLDVDGHKFINAILDKVLN